MDALLLIPTMTVKLSYYNQGSQVLIFSCNLKGAQHSGYVTQGFPPQHARDIWFFVSFLLELFEFLFSRSDVLLPALQALHAVHLVPPSWRVDVPHRPERSLYPAGHLSQQRLEVTHSLLVDDYPSCLVVRVSVPEHEDVFHHGLREKVWLLRTHICAGETKQQQQKQKRDWERNPLR